MRNRWRRRHRQKSQQHRLCCVYTLRDPRDGEIRYVGLSHNPGMRFVGHMTALGPGPKDQWVRALLQQGLTPQFFVEETFSDLARAQLFEIAYIKALRDAGTPLLNQTDGGECPTSSS
jgi:hypothetical protein